MMNKMGIWLVIFTGFFAPLAGTPDFSKNQWVIFPSQVFPFPKTYSDTTDSSGESMGGILSNSDSTILFNYTLRRHPKTQRDPYAGIYFTLDTLQDTLDAMWIDVSPYDSIRIWIKTEHQKFYENPKSFKIQLKLYIPNFTNIQIPETYAIMYSEVILTDATIYSLSLKNDFHLASCVFKRGDVIKLHNKEKIKNVFSIDVQTGSWACVGDSVSGTFKIDRIAFVRNNAPVVHHSSLIKRLVKIISGSIIAIVFIILCFIFYRRTTVHNKHSMLHNQIDLPAVLNDTLDAIRQHPEVVRNREIVEIVNIINNNPLISNQDIINQLRDKDIVVRRDSREYSSNLTNNVKSYLNINPSKLKILVLADLIIKDKKDSIDIAQLYKLVNEKASTMRSSRIDRLDSNEDIIIILKKVINKLNLNLMIEGNVRQ